MKKEKIRSDCDAALGLPYRLKEIIFATTAPDDVHASNAAREVEVELRALGHDLRVVLYGWGQLQLLIARHETA